MNGAHVDRCAPHGIPAYICRTCTPAEMCPPPVDDEPWTFTYRQHEPPLPRRTSGRIAAACVLALAVLAVAVVLREVTRQ